MKVLGAVFCLMCPFLAFADSVPTAKVECSGLTTVGVPIDPGYNRENYGSSELDVTAKITAFNKCDGSLNCWLTGDTTMNFSSVPDIKVQLRVVAVQKEVNGPIAVRSVVARLLRGDKILAVNESSTNTINIINPEPFQILRDKGQATMSIYEGFDKGLLKGNLLSQVEVSCSVKK